MNIVIMGAGEIGTAIAAGFETGHAVSFWDKMEGKVPDQKQLSEIIPDAELIFLCIPSTAVTAAFEEMQAYLSEKTFFVSVSKGIEPGTGRFMHELFGAHVSGDRFALLAGPMLAKELVRKEGGAAAVATANKKIFEILQTLFVPDYIALSYEPDVLSVALCEVLKNVYTLAVGIADGLGYGSNMKGNIYSHAIQESLGILKELGGNPEVFLKTSGVADFVATSMSELSYNRKVGFDIGFGNTFASSEGTRSLPLIIQKLKTPEQFPLLATLGKIVIEKGNPKQLMHDFVYMK